MDTINIFEKERNDIIQSFEKKKTYKILFKFKFIITNSAYKNPYEAINIDYLQCKIQNFCKKNNIKLRKIVLHNSYSRHSNIKIYGYKTEQILLHDFLSIFNKCLSVNNI